MTRKLHQQMKRAASRDYDDWLTAVPGIVAENEDPEHEHRIKVTIPLMDEDKVYDKWVRSLSALVLGAGYGSFFVPPKGVEVSLFGQLGQKHNLFYLGGLYNEDYKTPPDFPDASVCGFRVPGALKLISDAYMQLRATRLFIEADTTVRIIAPGGLFVNGRRLD